MTGNKKSKKITKGDGFCIGDTEEFKISIGALLGKDDTPKKNITEEEKLPPQNKTSNLSKVSIARRTAGCGGKTVTIITLPKETNIDTDALSKEMRKALGCGSRVEDGRIVLQGDIGDRAAEWFTTKKGVKKITRG